MATHRAWRLFVYATNGGGVCRIRELEFRSTSGGADQTGVVGNAIWSSDRSSLFGTRAFDNSLATDWESANNGARSGHWIGWDFGIGNEKDIVEIALTATATPGDTPLEWAMEWTDDNPILFGARWTRDWTVNSQTAWGTSEQRTFMRPAKTGQTYWRLFATTTPNGSNMAFAEVEFRASYGGANIATGGTVIKSSEFNNTTNAAINAFDGNVTTYWATASNVFPGWIGYILPAANTIMEARVWARNDATFNQAPGQFSLDCSADGITWVVTAEWATVPFPSAGFSNVVRVPLTTEQFQSKLSVAALVGAYPDQLALSKTATTALMGGWPNQITLGKHYVCALVQIRLRPVNGPVQIIGG